MPRGKLRDEVIRFWSMNGCFNAADKFDGPKARRCFKKGDCGLGYYVDDHNPRLDEAAAHGLRSEAKNDDAAMNAVTV